VSNFFLAKTDFLLKFPWDPDLKTCDHEAFFWALKKINAMVTFIDGIYVHHYPTLVEAENKKYYEKRRLRAAYYQQLAYQKIGIKGFNADIYTIPKGPFGLFSLYRRFFRWLSAREESAILTKIIWMLHRFSRSFLRKIKEIWMKRVYMR